jgi:SAM-dependent methyltransferase
VHGGDPRILGEDFCGTAAVSRAWAAMSLAHRAVGVDHDAAALAGAGAGPHRRVGLIRADVLAVREPVDLIAVLNFSICEWHDRARLVAYFRHAMSRLRPGGCIVCDIYGGADAFLAGSVDQHFTAPDGSRVVYTWEHRTTDPFTGRVVCAMHFAVRPASPSRARPQVLNDAFVYDWRLWSVPELRDAMTEAGLETTAVYPRQPDALDSDGGYHILPVQDASELGDSYSVYVVGRRGESRRPVSTRQTSRS